MTPLHLNILMHYYAIVGDYDQIYTNETRREYAYYLAGCGLLYTPQDKSQLFKLTKYGEKVVKKILNTFTAEVQ